MQLDHMVLWPPMSLTLHSDGRVAPIDDNMRQALNNTVTEMAKRGLRCVEQSVNNVWNG